MKIKINFKLEKDAVEKNTTKFKQTFSFATEIFNILKSQTFL